MNSVNNLGLVYNHHSPNYFFFSLIRQVYLKKTMPHRDQANTCNVIDNEKLLELYCCNLEKLEVEICSFVQYGFAEMFIHTAEWPVQSSWRNSSGPHQSNHDFSLCEVATTTPETKKLFTGFYIFNCKNITMWKTVIYRVQQ